jgi:hypothetical protein
MDMNSCWFSLELGPGSANPDYTQHSKCKNPVQGLMGSTPNGVQSGNGAGKSSCKTENLNANASFPLRPNAASSVLEMVSFCFSLVPSSFLIHSFDAT